ncbi:MAG: zinc ribbon domain-containing protein [Acidimicrobiales bacterium]
MTIAAADLEALLHLQDHDTRIDQELHRRAHLPERAQLAELGLAIAQEESARSSVAALLDVVAARQAEAERELKATEDRVVQVNKRLYGGTVSASRELQAMANDVEGLRRRASELEDRVLGLMEEREPLDKQLGEHDARLAEFSQRHGELSRQLGAAETEVDASLSLLQAQRQEAAAGTSAQLLVTYERLRERLGGVAVARLTGGRCDGCHLTLSAMELDRIRHEAAGSLEHCEQCGRILVISGT